MSSDFKPMRSIAPLPTTEIKFPVLASPKLDGIRVCKFEGKTRTKSGKPIPSKRLRAFIEAHIPEGFDMEIIMGAPNDPAVYSRTFSAAMTIESQEDPDLYVFDLCNDLKGFKIDRLKNIGLAYEALPSEVKARVKLVPQVWIHTMPQLLEFYNELLAQGYEGMITCQPDGFYKYGKCTLTTQDQLKWKPEEDTEGLIVDVIEGTTNENEAFTNEVGETKRSKHREHLVPNGRVGAFLVEVDGNKFKIGPGKFSHDELTAIWQEHLTKNNVIGRHLKFRALAYGTMTNGAARHGRALGFRAVEDMEPQCTSLS